MNMTEELTALIPSTTKVKVFAHQSESTRHGPSNFQQMKIKVVAPTRYGLEDQSCLPSQMSHFPDFFHFY